MRTRLWSTVFILVLTALIATSVIAAPTIGLKSFDAATFTYVYEVTLDAGDMLFALDIVTDGLIEPEDGPFWSYLDAPAGWDGSTSWGDTDAGHWAGPLLQNPGVYQFVWVVPDSLPSSLPIVGAAQMWSGSMNFVILDVVAPTAVPEPGSLAAMALFGAGLVPLLRRRIR